MKKIISKLNKTFDHKVRLGIMSVLMVNETVDFTTLKEMLEVTDGRLASHMKVLEGEDFVAVHKTFVGRKPKTTYTATPAGRQAFNDHLDALENLIRNIN